MRYRFRRGAVSVPRTTPLINVDVEYVELLPAVRDSTWQWPGEGGRRDDMVLRAEDGRTWRLRFIDEEPHSGLMRAIVTL